MLKEIWHDPVWSKVIAAAIIAAVVAYYLNVWRVLRRWITALLAFLLATAPVPHWILGMGILVVVVALGMIIGYVSRSAVSDKEHFANLEKVAPPPVRLPGAPNLSFHRQR